MDLAVRSVVETKKKAVIVDGLSKLDPYLAVRVCKMYGLNEREILDSIKGARGFTAYQICELLDRLDREFAGEDYSYLGVTGFDQRFSDGEMRGEEGRWLRIRYMRKMEDMVERHRIYSAYTEGIHG